MEAPDQKKLLKDAVASWKRRLQQAVLMVENRRRRDAGKPSYPEGTLVWLPQGPNAELYLLTLRVWSIRLGVTPEFIVDVLTKVFAKERRNDQRKEDEVSLGVYAHRLAGTYARSRLEEEVRKTFPCGENWKDMRRVTPVEISPEGDFPDERDDDYVRKIEVARVKFENETRRRRDSGMTSGRKRRR